MTIPGFRFAVHILLPVLLPDLAMKTITVFNCPPWNIYMEAWGATEATPNNILPLLTLFVY